MTVVSVMIMAIVMARQKTRVYRPLETSPWYESSRERPSGHRFAAQVEAKKLQ